VDDLLYHPEWDRDNQRFTSPSRCPYPDCVAPVDATHATEPVLRWCTVCNRPFEVTPFRPAPEAAPLDLHRRPATAYCTYTGQPLTAYSVVDWAEAGGEPGRSYCLNDARGAVFGPPSARRILHLKDDWTQRSIFGGRDDEDDFVSSVSVVRGSVVAVTARGRVGLFDATTGVQAPGRPLEWPTGSAHPEDSDRAVRYPPAFRGTQMVLAAPHEAQFRDLKSILFPIRGSAMRQHRMVTPSPGCQFLGAPLGIDSLASPVFCLLEGKEDSRSASISAAQLRFFDVDGNEIAVCAAGEITRAPIFDRRLGWVIWVDGDGRLSILTATHLGAGVVRATTTSLPDPILSLAVNLRPTFATARNSLGRSELWLSSALPRGGVELHHTLLDEAALARTTAWRWQTHMLEGVGEVHGIAVGGASPYAGNATSQLLAVATDRQVLSLDRSNVAGSGRAAMSGPESMGMTGSLDVPLLCSAGVVARLQSSLCLDSQGLGWSDESFQRKVPIAGLYRQAQGLALFGRRVYAGLGMGVCSYRIDVEEPEEAP
jgi:hypothetical protein